MTHLLANATPPPEALASWLEVAMYLIVSASAIVGLLCGIKSLRAKKEKLPSPFVVQGQVKYVPEATFDAEIKQAHGRMNRERDEAKALIAAAERRLQLEITRIETQVGQYNTNAEARANRINERIDDLSDKVSDAPSQVVELLLKTKGLLPA